MAADLNHVSLCARLTRDAESAGHDGSIAKLRVAFSSRKKEGEEWVEKPNYANVTVFRAGGILPFLLKGKQINIDGRLEWREWEQDGNTRQALDIVANQVQLIGGKSEDQADAPKADAEPDWLND